VVWFYLLSWLVFAFIPLWMSYRGAGSMILALIFVLIGSVFFLIAALSGVTPTVIVTGLTVLLAAGWMTLAKKRWRRTAAQNGLTFEPMERGWRIFGDWEGTPVEAQYTPVGMTFGTMAFAAFPKDHAGVELSRRGFGQKLMSGTGDEVFDDEVSIGGRRELAMAVLTTDVRETVRALVARKKMTVIADQVEWTHSRLVTEPRELGRLLEGMAGLVKMLTVRESEHAPRLAERMQTEPLREVRLEILDAALEAGGETALPVVESAKRHPDPETSVRAAALTDDVPLLESFADHDTPDVLREARSALVRLGKRTDAGAGGMQLVEEGTGGEVSLAEDTGGLTLDTEAEAGQGS